MDLSLTNGDIPVTTDERGGRFVFPDQRLRATDSDPKEVIMAGETQENDPAASAQAGELRQIPEANGERKPGFHDFLYTGELLETRVFQRHRSEFGGEAALELALAHANLAITMKRHRNEPGAIESAKDRLIEAVRALDPDNLPF